MPVEACTKDGKKGFRAGPTQVCFIGPGAKKKATDQLKAIKANSLLTHCISEVNKKHIRRESINGVEHIVVTSFTLPADIVMNGGLYPAEERDASFNSLHRTLAPIEHPTDENGNFLSANDPEAIHNFHAGAFNDNVTIDEATNRIKIDKFINVQEAKKTDRGKRLLDRIDEIESSDKPRPIHTSVAVFLIKEDLDEPQTNALGQEFTWVARDMVFDHDAILLDSVGAAQPNQGVGIGINDTHGEEIQVNTFVIKDDQFEPKATDNRTIQENAEHELSFHDIERQIHDKLNSDRNRDDPHKWVLDIFDDRFIFEDGDTLLSMNYSIVNDEVQFLDMPQAVKREVSYIPQINSKGNAAMKDMIINSFAKIGIHINGALADRLNSLLSSKSEDDDDRSDIIDRMASAAGIERNTLLKILSGDIETPPEDRLRGFAEVLGVSLESLTALVGNHLEGDLMKDLILNALKEAEIETEGLSDDQLFAAYNTLKASGSSDDDVSIANAVSDAIKTAVEPLTQKIDSLETQINSGATEEKTQLIEVVVNSKKYASMTKEMLEKLSLDDVKAMAANCGVSHGIPKTNGDNDSSNVMEFKLHSDKKEAS